MLKDIVVIELASVLAGPDVGMFFAELGAKVVKIENKITNGDVTRTWKLPNENKIVNTSAYYSSVNWNKEVLFLDLTQNKDIIELYELVKTADVVISNYKKDDDVKLKVDYNTLKKINPTLIYGAINGFGSTDKRVAFDVVLQAETGFMSMNGTSESGPLKLPIALIDIAAAHQLKEGLLLALYKREKDKKSFYVEVSLYDAAISTLKNQAGNWLMSGHIPKTLGSLHPNIAPYGEIFITRDNKQIVLAIGNDSQFKLLLKTMNINILEHSLIYTTNQLRVQNRLQLHAELSPYFKLFERDELMILFNKHNIPAGAIKNIQEVFEDSSAQILVNEEFKDDISTKRVKTVVFKLT